METNEPKEPIHWLKACGPVRYLACGESLRPTQSPTYQRHEVTCQDCLTEIWQIAYTAAGITTEHLCELSQDPHGKYAAAVRSGHYEAVSLERWNGEIFTSVHAWRDA